MRLDRFRLAAGLTFAAMAAGALLIAPQAGPFALPAAHAQNLGQRVVAGYVADQSSTPVAGATVFLKNLKTKSIRSYTSTADGKFRFVQVNMVQDYDLWAEKGNKKSAVKTVSSWDSRKEYETELRLK